MSRSEARILTSVWADADFRVLPALAQRAYFLALSQPNMSFCGVVAYTARRWARYATDTTPAAMTKAIATLVSSQYVVVDNDTEELWVRSFVKYDGVLKSPNLVMCMARDFGAIQSPSIREGFLEGLGEGFLEGLPERFPKGFDKPLPQGFVEGFTERFGELSAGAYASMCAQSKVLSPMANGQSPLRPPGRGSSPPLRGNEHPDGAPTELTPEVCEDAKSRLDLLRGDLSQKMRVGS